jgi:glycogen(starch) synthase
VIVCSDFMREEVAELFGRSADRIAVIPNGIDPSQWRADDARRRRMRREYGSPLVVFAGRLEPEKGVQTLIEAMPLLRRRVPPARAVVIGEGTASADLKAQARRRRLGAAVTFTGYVSEPDLRALVSAANAAVVPSLYEPFGFVALEAAVLGAPLVVSRTGGLAEIVDDGRTGWQYAPGDATELAHALEIVITDPKQAKARAQAARLEIVERFAWPVIAGLTDEVYDTVLNG